MSIIEAGRSHIYTYCGAESEGWRIRPGWVLDEILNVETNPRDNTYEMTCKVSVPADYTGALIWPPFTIDVVTDDEVPVP